MVWKKYQTYWKSLEKERKEKIVTASIILVFLLHEFVVITCCIGWDSFPDGDDSELSDFAKNYTSSFENVHRRTTLINASFGDRWIVLGKTHIVIEYTNITERIRFLFKVETVTYFKNRPFDTFTSWEVQPLKRVDNFTVEEVASNFEGSKEINLEERNFHSFAITNASPYINATEFRIKYKLINEQNIEFTPFPTTISLSSQNVSVKSVWSPFYTYRLPHDFIALLSIGAALLFLWLYLSYVTAIGFLKKREIIVNEELLKWKYRSEVGIYYVGYLVIFNSTLISMLAFTPLILVSTRFLVAFMLILFAILLVSRGKLRNREAADNYETLLKEKYNKKEEADAVKQYNAEKTRFKSSETKETLTAIFTVLTLVYLFYGLEFAKILSISL